VKNMVEEKEVKFLEELRKKVIESDEIEFLEYLKDCCENIIENKSMEEKYGLIPPMLQLAKMRQELDMRLTLLKAGPEAETSD